MRIRKHAKFSPLLYATSSLDPGTLPQAHICQLNQSPWDVMYFSPPRPSPPPTPPSQVYGNDSFAGNGSSRDSIAVIRREWTNELNKATKCEYSGSISGGAASDETEQEACTSPKDNSIILCCKTDGKSWQCRRESAKGNSLCEHHLLMVRSYSNYNSAHYSATKNSEKSSVETRGRPRSKKRAAPSLSNPNEFYYYSGFGPRWGKKRGEVSKSVNEELNMPKNYDLEDDKEASSLCDIEDDRLDGDEDEKEKNEEIGKKRTRKPIKARSLKSLM